MLLFDSFFPDGKTWAKELAPPIADRFAHLSNSNQKDLIHRAASTKCYMHEMLRKVLHVTEDHLPKILYKSKQIKCCSSGGRKSLRRPITFFFFYFSLLILRIASMALPPFMCLTSFPGQIASSLFIPTVLHLPTNDISTILW